MAGRKKTPDIMAKIMESKDSKPEKRKARKTVSRPARKPSAGRSAAKESPGTSRRRRAPQKPREKLKATFYLSPASVEALEASWLKLRSLAGAARGQVSKSGLVEVALLKLRKETAQAGRARSLLKSVQKAGH